MTDKTSLRRQLRAARRSYVGQMSPADRMRAFSVLPSPMRTLFADKPIVAGYAPIGDECDPMALLWRIHELGCPIALPFFSSPTAAMQFRSWIPGTALSAAPFGGGQPPPYAPSVAPALLLLPLVGFDRAGHRLGQGGGHYDRALAQLPSATTVGLAWSAQEATALPSDPWDMPLDHILTEREWITPMKDAL